MRTKTTRCNMSLLVIIGVFLLPLTSYSLKETEKTITKEATISSSTLIRFENKLGPVKVETWDKNQVRLVTKLIIDGKDEVVDKLIDHISRIEFSTSAGEISLNTKFYTLYSETFPGGIKIVLTNGDIIRGISKIKISYTLTIPKGNPLALVIKYEDLELPDLNGELSLTLYESDLKAGLIGGKSQISMKYSKGSIGSLQDVDLTLYESKTEISHTGNLNLISKYSELTIQEAGELILDSYEDKLIINKHLDVGGKAKYTTLSLGDFTTGGFDLYECKLTAGNVTNMKIKAKYSIFNLKSVKSINFHEAYEIKFSSSFVGMLSGSSKYGIFKIYHLDGSLDMANSYEDDFTIGRVGGKFTGVYLKSKYTNLDFTFEPGTLYKIDANFKYTDLDFEESAFKEIRYHKDGSDFQYEGIVKGADEKTCPVLKLNMYEGNVTLK
ncbi:MAG: hypothetical protein HQ542_07540 [Bacteroidia bacterium]|nr:hypothetical protein [Bacteroidia bacterium]